MASAQGIDCKEREKTEAQRGTEARNESAQQEWQRKQVSRGQLYVLHLGPCVRSRCIHRRLDRITHSFYPPPTPTEQMTNPVLVLSGWEVTSKADTEAVKCQPIVFQTSSSLALGS